MVQRLALAVLLLATAAACGGSTEQEIFAPDLVTRCQMSLATPSPLPADAAQATASLSTSRDCTWSVSVGSPWLSVTPASGQGAASLTLAATQNPQGRARSTTIDINDQQFTVTQNGQPCRFEVAPANIEVEHQGGRVAVRVTTLEGCSWTTQVSQGWMRIVSGSGGDGPATIELAVDSNRGAERSAVLSVATARVTVTQEAGPDDRTECQYSIGPGARTFPAAGGQGTFRVSTMPACAWGAASTQPWITILSTTNGSGTADVQYRVDANASTGARSGAITVGTRRHVIQQQGAASPSASVSAYQ
jgi:hypothetical protein